MKSTLLAKIIILSTLMAAPLALEAVTAPNDHKASRWLIPSALWSRATANPAPLPPDVDPGPDQTVCEGDQVTLTATNPNGVNLSWDQGVVDGQPFTPPVGVNVYTLTADDGVTSIDYTLTVTVEPNHTITPGENRSACVNASMSTIVMTLGGGATGANVTGLPPGISSAVSGNTLTLSGSPTTTGTFNYDVTTTGNSCATATTGGTITVDENQTITAGASREVCVNETIAVITLTFGGSATGVQVSGLPAGLSSSVSGNTVTISGAPTAIGIFSYSVLTTGPVCTPAAAGGAIIVNANHSITAGSDRDLCIQTAMSAITLTLGGGATGANVSGLPTGVNSSVSGNTLTISGTPTQSGTFPYSVTTTGNSCITASASGTIEVTPNNTIALTSGPATLNQDICFEDAIVPITFSSTGATGANFNGLPAGVSGSWTNNVATIEGTPTQSGTFNFSVDLTGGCGAIGQGGAIEVNPQPIANAGPDQVICTDNPVVVLLGSVSNTSSQVWSSPGGEGSFADPSSPNTTFTPSAGQLASGAVTLTLTTTGALGDCAETFDTINITFTEAFNAFFTFDDPYCSDLDELVVPLLTGTEGGFYSTSAGGIDLLTGAINPSDFGPGTHDITYTVPATGGCAQFDTTLSITVNAALSNVSVGSYATDFFCNQSPLALSGNADNAAGFAWSETSSSGSFSDPASASTSYEADGTEGEVTFVLTAIGLEGCSDDTDQVVFTAVPPQSGNLQNPPTNFCEETPLTLAAAESPFNGFYDFTWSFEDEQGNPVGSIVGPANESTVLYDPGTYNEESTVTAVLQTEVDGNCANLGFQAFDLLLQPVLCDYFEMAGNILVVNTCADESEPHFYQWGCGSQVLEGENENFLLYTPYLDDCNDFWVGVSLYENGACTVYEGDNFPTPTAEEDLAKATSVFPNPAVSTIHVAFPASVAEHTWTYHIFGADGRLARSGIVRNQAGVAQIDVSQLVQGLHILSLEAGDARIRKPIVILK